MLHNMSPQRDTEDRSLLWVLTSEGATPHFHAHAQLVYKTPLPTVFVLTVW